MTDPMPEPDVFDEDADVGASDGPIFPTEPPREG
jgi:hypothetical protein